MKKEATIYFTSDTHGYLMPTNYQTKEEKPMGVFYASQAFSKDGNTLILDGGDTIQGSPLAKYVLQQKERYNPIIDIFNRGKYDFITLGNHDFNHGYEVLKEFLDGSNAKCLASNVADLTGNLPLKSYTIKELENGLKLGIVGLVTDYVAVWENPKNMEKLQILDAFTRAKECLEEIKNQCDITICLYHGGFEANLETGEILTPTKENVGYRICKELNYDLLLTSHQHMPVELTKVNNTYVYQNIPNAVSYGKLELTLENGMFSCKGQRVGTVLNREIKIPDPLVELNEKVEAFLDTKIGVFSEEIRKEEKIVTATKGSKLANFCNQIQMEYTGADISCASLSNDIIGFPKEVSIRNIISAYPFPNTIFVLEITKEILKEALERVAEYFDIEDGEIIISKRFIEPKIEHYNFDFFMGIDYTIDVSRPLGERVTRVLFKGKELEENRTYTLAMNNYRATGTGGYDCYKGCKVIREYGVDIQEIITDYIQERGTIKLPEQPDYQVVNKVHHFQ